MSDLSETAPDHEEKEVKAVVAQGMLTPPKATWRFSPPTPICEGSGPALQSLLKGWAEGHMFPFHRNPELF